MKLIKEIWEIEQDIDLLQKYRTGDTSLTIGELGLLHDSGLITKAQVRRHLNAIKIGITGGEKND